MTILSKVRLADWLAGWLPACLPAVTPYSKTSFSFQCQFESQKPDRSLSSQSIHPSIYLSISFLFFLPLWITRARARAPMLPALRHLPIYVFIWVRPYVSAVFQWIQGPDLRLSDRLSKYIYIHTCIQSILDLPYFSYTHKCHDKSCGTRRTNRQTEKRGMLRGSTGQDRRRYGTRREIAASVQGSAVLYKNVFTLLFQTKERNRLRCRLTWTSFHLLGWKERKKK